MHRDEVVVVVTRFPERSQTFVVEELRHLASLGIATRVFHLEDPYDPAPEVTDLASTRLADPLEVSRGELVRRLLRLVPRWGAGPVRALQMLVARRGPAQAAACRRAVELAERLQRRPARVHAHFAHDPAGVAMFAGAILGVPWGFTGHGHDLYVDGEDLDLKLDRADLVVDVSAYNARWLADRHPGHRARHVLVPCGVDTRRFVPVMHDNESLHVVAVGRLVPKKGFDDLIRATADLRERGLDPLVTLIGDGEQRAALETLAADLDLQETVRFLGSCPPDVVRSTMASASLFCLPCVVADDGDRDAQPVVVKEAMATALPVVATDEVGLPEIVVDGETGRLVPPRNPRALADALADLAEDPEARRRMGEAGRRRVVARFDHRVTVPRLVAAWGLA